MRNLLNSINEFEHDFNGDPEEILIIRFTKTVRDFPIILISFLAFAFSMRSFEKIERKKIYFDRHRSINHA